LSRGPPAPKLLLVPKLLVMNKSALRLKLIACEILYREFCAAVAESPNRVDVEFLPKGLHDIGQPTMQRRLMETLSAVDESTYDAVLLGYGLCSNGVVGLTARSVPLVIPRAHDCITLFLGSTKRHLEYFQANPGAYYKTSGWIERGENLEQAAPEGAGPKRDMSWKYEDLVVRYGEDNAKFLHDQLGNMTRNYGKLTFIEMGIEPDDRFERHTRELAAERGWRYEKLAGDMTLIRQLVDGPWDEDRFLVLQPGCRVAASFDERVVKAEMSGGDHERVPACQGPVGG